MMKDVPIQMSSFRFVSPHTSMPLAKKSSKKTRSLVGEFFWVWNARDPINNFNLDICPLVSLDSLTVYAKKNLDFLWRFHKNLVILGAIQENHPEIHANFLSNFDFLQQFSSVNNVKWPN